MPCGATTWRAGSPSISGRRDSVSPTVKLLALHVPLSRLRPRSFVAAPTVAFVRRWGISIASFVSGVLTLFVFHHGLPHVRWIVGYVVLLWLIFAVLTQVRQALEARGRRFVVTAADYTIQSLYHGLLLFTLPAYWASTTLTSINVVFFGLLVTMILLATFDPWYDVIVHPRPWLGLAFFVVSIFAALNVALPLIDVPPHVALLLAAIAASLALTPVVRRELVESWREAFLLCAVLGIAAAVVTHVVRTAIPPAPVALARATLARDVSDGEPIHPVGGVVTLEQLREWNGVIAYTAVYAPAGLRQPIEHVWRHDGRVVTVIRLSPVQGGRREGFRTYSRKNSFSPDAVGRWAVDVTTTSGQLIGRLRFRVVAGG